MINNVCLLKCKSNQAKKISNDRCPCKAREIRHLNDQTQETLNTMFMVNKSNPICNAISGMLQGRKLHTSGKQS
jgi:hypothetical protein